jgi:hypothetical protein
MNESHKVHLELIDGVCMVLQNLVTKTDVVSVERSALTAVAVKSLKRSCSNSVFNLNIFF